MSKVTKPLLVGIDGHPGYVNPAVHVGERVFVERGACYGGGMNNLFAKANYAAKDLAKEVAREIALAAKRLHLS